MKKELFKNITFFYKNRILTISIILLGCFSVNAHANGQKSKPLFIDGKYYYSKDDTHVHINMSNVAAVLAGKLISPSAWYNAAASLFFSNTQEEINPMHVLQPTKVIPPERSLQPQLCWIGHATFLIQINNINILTDPIYGDVTCGPLTITKRTLPPGIDIENLPPIDIILLSHNHFDHTDLATLTTLYEKFDPIVYVPQGDYDLVKEVGFSHVIENNWWNTHQVMVNRNILSLTFLPAYHWSIRFPPSTYRTSLWGSWMINNEDTHIYFAGDTAYGHHFKEIANEFPSIDIALMPISPTNPNSDKHKHCHVDAKEAIDAFMELNARIFIPMHFGTFWLGDETLTWPIEQLHHHWQLNTEKLSNKKLIFAQCGQILDIKAIYHSLQA